MALIDKIKQINFKQPKYMIPAIIYFPLLFTGYFVISIFTVEKLDLSNMETTEYYNDKLPDANIKGDGIGDKYSNMLGSYGKIKDASAVENIGSDSINKKEEYQSQYSDAELAAMDQQSEEAQQSMEKLRKLQESVQAQQTKTSSSTTVASNPIGNTDSDNETLAQLRQELVNAQNKVLGRAGQTATQAGQDLAAAARGSVQGDALVTGSVTKDSVSEHAVHEIDKDDKPEEVVKKHDVSSDYFNTIVANDPQSKLIRAIVDEDIKAVDGSRVRLRLLDDIDVGDRTIRKGHYLYCTMSGFSSQRVKASVSSVLVDDELVKVNLSVYDTDGIEGLYVPKSNFSETSKDIASGALGQSMNLSSSGSSGNEMRRWGLQALQNSVTKMTNAVSKNIRKNKVKVKYGTQVYLINSKENKNDR